MTRYHAIIIGSGQGGNPLALAFAKAGKSTALIEMSAIGGTCINRGCSPTKTMIASGRVAYLAKRSTDYGIHTSTISVDMNKIRERKRDLVTSFRSGGEKRLHDAGVHVIMGKAAFTDTKTITVQQNDGGESVCEGEIIVVNVGERPTTPKIDGLDGVIKDRPESILDSTSIQELDIVPKSLLVVGGGYIGLEFGQLFARLGSQVTILQRGKRLLPREDPEVTDCLTDILKEDGITVKTEAVPVKMSIAGDELAVDIKILGETTTLQTTHILFAAGRTPNTDLLNISAAQIKTNQRGHILTDDKLATNVPGIYAIGDVRGPPAFTHISYDDFRILRDALNLAPDANSVIHTVSERASIVPYCMYTDPQLGHVGLHLSEIDPQDRSKIQVASMPMAYVARALETAESRGVMKAVINKETGSILGFTALGIEGGELMSVVQMAMMGNLKWWHLREATFAHPTIAECLNNLWGFLKDVE
jgi:pyruvate/2-oxoglutarate dehydrogenase complex dihydrolipoamide dehydrogenase (E3) component